MSSGSFMRTLSVFVAVLLIQASSSVYAEWGSYKEWMNLIREDCSPTVKGRAKRLMDEKYYWAEVNTSMGSWIEDMRLSRYENICRANFQTPGDANKLLSCLASIKHDFDWYDRCKSQVVYSCIKTGGFCR